MKRRTLLQAGLASLLLPRMEPSVACQGGGPVYWPNVLDLAGNGAIINTDISKVLDRNFGKARWNYENDLDVAVQTPDMLDDQAFIPYSIWLHSLPRHWERCTQVDLFSETDFHATPEHNVLKSFPVDGKGLEQVVYGGYAARPGSEKVSRIVYWIARCFPSPDAPIYFSVSYRGLLPRSTVYAVFSGVDVSGNRRAVVYKHSSGKSPCGGSAYSIVLGGGQVSDQAHRESRIRQFTHRYRFGGGANSPQLKAASGKAYSLLMTDAAEILDGRVLNRDVMAGYYPNRPDLPFRSSIPAYRYHRAEYFSELEVFHQRKSLARVDLSVWAYQHTRIYLPPFPEETKLDVHLKHNSGFSRRIVVDKTNRQVQYFEQAL